MVINWNFTDSKELFVLTLENSALTHVQGKQSPTADASLTLTRATLNASSIFNSSGVALVNGTVPWSDAQTMVGGKRVTRFAPLASASDELQVRYYTGARSASDPTVCLFRAEFPSGAATPSSTREVAERISDSRSTTLLSISGRNGGSILRLQSSFTPVFKRTGSSTSTTTAYVDVNIRNPRRD